MQRHARVVIVAVTHSIQLRQQSIFYVHVFFLIQLAPQQRMQVGTHMGMPR